jgi:hypothetical protein
MGFFSARPEPVEGCAKVMLLVENILNPSGGSTGSP